MANKRKRIRHSAEQVVKKLKTADAMLAVGKTIGHICQAIEISEATYHRWREKFGGMDVAEAKRLKELEVENARLKKLLAESELEKSLIKELLEGNW